MPITFPNKPGIIAYLTAGDPDLSTTRDIALSAIDNGADVLELGVPFSDPLADGPVIQRASERAVARGVRLTDVLQLAKDLRQARPLCRSGPLLLPQPRRQARHAALLRGGRAATSTASCSPT